MLIIQTLMHTQVLHHIIPQIESITSLIMILKKTNQTLSKLVIIILFRMIIRLLPVKITTTIIIETMQVFIIFQAQLLIRLLQLQLNILTIQKEEL
jgi:hypothetical protein